MYKVNFSLIDQIAIARKKLAFLREDYPAFQEFNPVRFNHTFLDEYQQTLEVARDTIDDGTIQDVGIEKTEKAEEVMKECRKAYRTLKYFVEDAFKDNRGRRQQFGLDDFTEVRRSRQKMIVFMSKLYQIAGQHRNELINVGYTTEKLANLIVLRDELESATLDQEIFMGQRLEVTQERQERFNNLWHFVRETCRAGKLIFEEVDEVKYDRYVLPSSNVGKEVVKVGENDGGEGDLEG